MPAIATIIAASGNAHFPKAACGVSIQVKATRLFCIAIVSADDTAQALDGSILLRSLPLEQDHAERPRDLVCGTIG